MEQSLSIEELGGRLRSGALDPVALVESCLARIDRFDPVLRSFVHVDRTAALEAARTAAHEIACGFYRGPLHGIPLAVKDVIDVAAMPTRCGSNATGDGPALRDAEVIWRLRSAGAVVLGKTATYEFAFGGIDPEKIASYPRNPWDVERWTGASSSGSAACVSGGLVPASLGTDSAGSVRMPAAFCGITGFKPSFGRISLDGVEPLAPSLDHCGLLARTAADVAVLYRTILGVPSAIGSGTVGDLRGVRVGVPYDYFLSPEISEDVARSTLEAIDTLRTLGAEIVAIELPPARDYHRCCFSLLMAEALAIHGRGVGSRPDAYGSSFRQRLLDGPARLGLSALAAAAQRPSLVGRLLESFTACDLIAYPTTSFTAPPIQDLTPLRFLDRPVVACPANLAGLPAISVCCGFSSQSLPFGLHLMGRPNGDLSVLEAAIAYQKITEWHAARPPSEHQETAPRESS